VGGPRSIYPRAQGDHASVTHAPGIDFPMDGGIWMNYAYPWPLLYDDDKNARQPHLFRRGSAGSG